MRVLNWPTCYNVRDLGGLATKSGQKIKPGTLVRADNLSRLTQEGHKALRSDGVRTVIDLRSPEELGQETYPFSMADASKPVYLNLPFEDRQHPNMAQMNATRSVSAKYGLMLDHFKHNVGVILTAFSDAQPGGVAFHCQAGKDRTGLIVALLLSIAGVPVQTIAEDYAVSEAALRPLYEKLVVDAGNNPSKIAQLPPEPVATPETMLTVFDDLTLKYGNVERYVRQTGITDQTLMTIQTRLLENDYGTINLKTD
ncbi:MAG: tyrosine-protein phosphatase [Chloroflexota bacterium]